MEVKSKKSEKLTSALAYLSVGILILAKTLTSFRHLIGFKKGYAPHNFAFSGLIYDPLLFLSFTLGAIVIFKTVKNWNNYRKKIFLLGLITPSILIWIFETIK